MRVADPGVPLRRHVVLVGAGHSHMVFVRMFGMNPIPGVAVTLVNVSREVVYSAMVPAHVGGEYPRSDITIDLVPFCRAAGVRLLVGHVAGIDREARRALVDGRPPLGYDVLCLAPGSVTAPPDSDPRHWSLRPLDALLAKIAELDQRLERDPAPFHLAVIGGGPSGCELALALARRYAARPAFRATLLQRDERLLPQLPLKAADAFAEGLSARGVTVRTKAEVQLGEGGSLKLASGEPIPSDAVLWAVQGHAPPELARFGLPLSPDGYLAVRDTLQSSGHDSIFATGDAVAFASKPELARSGVHAVRQGPLLFENVRKKVEGEPLEEWVPQARVLYALNRTDGTAVACWGGHAWHGTAPRRIKDWIDRQWVAKFRPEPMAAADEEQLPPAMRCGGCGSKVPADVLSAVIGQLDMGDTSRILLGARAGEDAAVHRLRAAELGAPPETLVEVQTVDYFKAFLDDPYTFGRIAALHSLSDLHAMNARPFCALAIATLPPMRGRLLEATLLELLSGAVRTLKASGAALTGGHTTEGHELALGFAVTGYAEEARLFRKGALKEGDVLVLTKPIGTGALLAAWMRRASRGAWFEGVVRGMLKDSVEVVPVLNRVGIAACTDITGFGLAGHLVEMLSASGLAARLDARRVPRYAGFDEVVRSGVVSTLHAANARTPVLLEGLGPMPAWLHDPQTSGGLLIGVRPEKADDLVRAIREVGHEDAAVIGEVVARSDPEAPVITAYLSKA